MASGSDSEDDSLLPKSDDTVLEASGFDDGDKNIDSLPEKRWLFYSLIGVIEGLALCILVLIIFWWATYLTAFDWYDINKRFAYHPMFMVLGFIVTMGNSTIIYRVFRTQDKFTIKVLHILLHSLAAVFMICGLYAAFTVNTELAYGNLYTMHSWVGIITVSLFVLQYLFGFSAYFWPKFDEEKRRLMMPSHRFMGSVILMLAIVTCVMGLTEEMLFSYSTTYILLGGVSLMANFLALLLLLYGVLVGVVLVVNTFKRIVP